jgi:acetyl esterase/lipase
MNPDFLQIKGTECLTARAAGFDVTLIVGQGLFHCYPACAPMFPEAKKAMDEICGFVKKHLEKR